MSLGKAQSDDSRLKSYNGRDMISSEWKLKPFFPYYGSKWLIAKWYPPPSYSHLIEPFAGSAGYSHRYPLRSVTLVEKYTKIARLWKWLVKVSQDEILALPDLRPEQSVSELRIPIEAKTLIGFWICGAVQRPKFRMSSWAKDSYINGSSQLYWGPKVRERIASQLDMIRHWVVIEGDYTSAPDINATWFVDPPYIDAGRWYVHSSIDYSRLAEWCRKRRGQTIVCEAEPADWLPFKPLLSIKGQKSKRSIESVWINQ
jgi:hypothetical protein